jgi:hypothetical protein
VARADPCPDGRRGSHRRGGLRWGVPHHRGRPEWQRRCRRHRERRRGRRDVMVVWAGEVLKGMSAAATGSGYGLLVFSAAGAAWGGGWERRALVRLGGTLIDGAILIAPSQDVTCVNVPVVEVAAQGTVPRHQDRGSDGPQGGAVRAAARDVPRELGGAAFTMLLALIGSGPDGPGARPALRYNGSRIAARFVRPGSASGPPDRHPQVHRGPVVSRWQACAATGRGAARCLDERAITP